MNMVNELKDFYEIIALISNTTTAFVNFKQLKLKFPVKSIKKALDNTQAIEDILTHLFIRKQVTWERYDYENLDWSQNSLRDLRDKCDDLVVKVLSDKSQNQDQFHFLASLLKVYGSMADEGLKDLVKSDLTDKSLDQVLKNFRKKSYPVIITLTLSLEDKNLIKAESLLKLEQGMKYSKLRFSQIIPQWNIEP